MSWITNALTSSIGRKLVMGITGLFLIVFLLTHLAGNISLLYRDGTAFNEYAHFMKHNPLIIIGEVVLFLGFIFHIVQGIMLITKNKAARPQPYAVAHKNEKVSWTSKMMGPFGIVILVFLLIHLYDFFRFKYFAPIADMPGTDMSDLYSKVQYTFQGNLPWVIIYVFSMVVVGLHLNHGFQSAFQTLGINHKKYSPAIKALGNIYSIVIPALFALIPVLIYLGIYIK